MKKILSIFVVAILLCLCACNTHIPNNTDTAVKDPPISSSENNTAETMSSIEEALPIPNESMEFSFLSGAGAWRTILTLNRDGTFTGFYLDSEMGEIGEGYPKGSAYTCSFSGKFADAEKVDEYSYKMTLTEVKTERTFGEEWIEDEIRYIASEPFGIDEGTNFIFYLPTTPIDKVPQEFLTWWPFRYSQQTEPKTTLSCYGILNVSTNYGFFTSE